MKNIVGKAYIRFFNEIKSHIVSARFRASRSVNKEMIRLYWDIGSIIAACQEQHNWGRAWLKSSLLI